MPDLVWREHLSAVYRFSIRLTASQSLAEDLAQETMLRGWQMRRELKNERAERVWLFKIANNLWRDWLRRGKVRPPTATLEVDHATDQDEPSKKLVEKERLIEVLDELNRLPERQRQVLHLHACEELSLPEIGEILQISTDAAKASLYEARKAMRKRLATEAQSVTLRGSGSR